MAFVIPVNAEGGPADGQVRISEDEPDKGSLEVALGEAEQNSKPERHHAIRTYLRKFKGGVDKRAPIPPVQDLFFSWFGAFLGIIAVSFTDKMLFAQYNFPVLVGSFGASAVLVYGVPESKLAQPRNFLGGQIISAIVGVLVRLACGKIQWLANAVGMSLALLAMQLTSTTHPPGGATALIACSAPHMAAWHGFQFLIAVTLGSTIMLILALIFNNMCKDREYPTYWF